MKNFIFCLLLGLGFLLSLYNHSAKACGLSQDYNCGEYEDEK